MTEKLDALVDALLVSEASSPRASVDADSTADDRLEVFVSRSAQAAVAGAFTLVLVVGRVGGSGPVAETEWRIPSAVEVVAIKSADDLLKEARAGAAEARRWFVENKAALVSQFKNRYVAIYQNRVVDQHKDVNELATRFFAQHGTVGAFFGFVGDEPARRLTPLDGGNG